MSTKKTTAKAPTKITKAASKTTSTDSDTTPVDPKQTPVLEPKPSGLLKAKYLIMAMYDLPYYAGVALPPGKALLGYKTTTLTEKKAGEGITRKQAMAAISRAITAENKRLVKNVTITAVSLLPSNW